MPKSQFVDPKQVRAAGSIHFEDFIFCTAKSEVYKCGVHQVFEVVIKCTCFDSESHFDFF